MRFPSWRRTTFWVLGLSLLAFAAQQFLFAPVHVVAHTVGDGEVVAEVMGTGTLEARVTTTIGSRIQERLVDVLVDQGDLVEAGQLLARLDDTESRQLVAIAGATLAAAKQTEERVRADLARAEAMLALARLDQKQKAELSLANVVSQLDADKANEGLRAAEADLRRANAAIAEVAQQILVAQENLILRREQVAFTELRSPYAGLVIRRDRDPGDILVPGASVLQLVSLGELWIRAWVDETAMSELAVDQPARIGFRAEPARTRPGKVARLAREMDRETREGVVDVRVLELPPNWAIGQRAEVRIEVGRRDRVLRLPPAFVAWREGRPGVFRAVAGRAQWCEIGLGLRGLEHVEIARGLAAGDQVVRAPNGQPAALAEGQRLHIAP